MSARRLPYLGTPQSVLGGRGPRIPLRLWAAVLVLCLLVLTACGGGGSDCPVTHPADDGSEPLPPACEQEQPDPARTPAPQPPACQAHPELCQ